MSSLSANGSIEFWSFDWDSLLSETGKGVSTGVSILLLSSFTTVSLFWSFKLSVSFVSFFYKSFYSSEIEDWSTILI